MHCARFEDLNGRKMRILNAVLMLMVFVNSIENEDNREILINEAEKKLKHSLQQQMGLVKEIKMSYKYGYELSILRFIAITCWSLCTM